MTKKEEKVQTEAVQTEAVQTETVKAEDVKKTVDADDKDTVTFRLFKDNDRYRDDVFVSVNGKAYIVKRGVEVEMPRAVYEVLMNAREQMEEARKVMDEAAYKE